jgi:hypothetical protein
MSPRPHSVLALPKRRVKRNTDSITSWLANDYDQRAERYRNCNRAGSRRSSYYVESGGAALSRHVHSARLGFVWKPNRQEGWAGSADVRSQRVLGVSPRGLLSQSGFVSTGLSNRRNPQTWRSLPITKTMTTALPAIHPGGHLAEEVQALNMSAEELASKIDVPTNCVTRVLNGTRSITGDTACGLLIFSVRALSFG